MTDDDFMVGIRALQERCGFPVPTGEMASVHYKMPYEILKKSPKNGDFSTMLGLWDEVGMYLATVT